jgi:hypothetical protein
MKVDGHPGNGPSLNYRVEIFYWIKVSAKKKPNLL